VTGPVRDHEELLLNVEMEAFADLDSAVADSRETLGVDQASTAALADVVTLRTAHVDIDMHPLWVRDSVRALDQQTATPVVPSIRTAGDGRPMSGIPDDDLVTAMQMALHGGSQGVSLFSTGANVGRITDDQWETIERVFDEFATFEREHWPQS